MIAILLFAVSATASAQSTPPDFFYLLSHVSATSTVRDYGDTIDFEGYFSNTLITDNYWQNGAIFSGYDGSGTPVTYDYGINVYTSVLHSDDWYNPFKLRFVDANDTSLSKPISRLSFFNPVNSEIDYIRVMVYDNNENIVASYMSTSPEWVSIDVPSNNGAYVVFDDSASTAYVIDLVSFEPGGKPTGIAEQSAVAINSVVYPNPVDETFAIMINGQEKIQHVSLYIFNSSGVPVKQSGFHSNAVTFKKEDFAPGIYFYSWLNSEGRQSVGSFVVQ